MSKLLSRAELNWVLFKGTEVYFQCTHTTKTVTVVFNVSIEDVADLTANGANNRVEFNPLNHENCH